MLARPETGKGPSFPPRNLPAAVSYPKVGQIDSESAK
jgi:hypothetical protein